MYAQGVCGQLNMDAVKNNAMNSREFETIIPREVCISLKQGNAAAARPVVCVGQRVACGQLIGEAVLGLSVPVYASISGVVADILEIPANVHENVSHIVIRSDGDDGDPAIYLKPDMSRGQWLKNIGIIEMLHTRQAFYRRCFSQCRVAELKVAAFDREPFVYSDYRLIMECPSKVIFGAKVLAEIWGIDQVAFYVCDDEIRYVLETAAARYDRVIAPLRRIRFYKVEEDMYARKCATLSQSEGGFWCSAVELCAVYDGFYDEKPMTGRGLTVSGAVRYPKNLWVPNGTHIRDLLEYCGGVLGEKGFVDPESLSRRQMDIIEGGPLGGHCVNVATAATSLTTESVLVLPRARIRELPCIQCQACVEICPVDLKPMHIENAMKHATGDVVLLDVDQCVECGWCSYVCPSGLRLKEMAAAAKKMPAAGRVAAQVAGSENSDSGSGSTGSGSHQHFQDHGTDSGSSMRACDMEAGADGFSGSYIELDDDIIASMEPLVPETQSGPYIHGRRTTEGMMQKMSVVLMIMLGFYALAAGPWMLVKGVLSVGACYGFGWLYTWMGGRTETGIVRRWQALATGLLIAMAFYGNIPLRWMLAADFLAFFISRITRLNPALWGTSVILAVYGLFKGPVTGGDWGLSILWMAAWLYMIYEEMVVPWKTVLFLAAFGLMGTVLAAGSLWSPMVFMGGVIFMNDYRNGGRDTSMGRILAVFCGAVCGIFAAFMPASIAVCLGLMIANIIACNLIGYTI